MAVRITGKKLAELGNEAAEKGGKAVDDFTRLLDKAGQKARDEFAELMGKPFKGQQPVKPAKKPLPEPSKPTPELKQEPAPKPGAKPEPKTKADLKGSRPPKKKKEGEEEEEPGLVKIQDVVKIVRGVLEGTPQQVRDWLSLIPVLGTAIGIKELTEDAKADQIIAIVKRYRLKWNRKRTAEKLPKPWGKWPNGEPRRYIMRREGGAGFKVPDVPPAVGRQVAMIPIDAKGKQIGTPVFVTLV